MVFIDNRQKIRCFVQYQKLLGQGKILNMNLKLDISVT